MSQCEALCEDSNAFALFRCPSRRRGCGQFCRKATKSIDGEDSSGKCSRLCRGRRNAVCGWNGTLYDNPCHAKCLGVATSFTCRQKGFIFNEKGCEENCKRNTRPEIAEEKDKVRKSQIVPAVIYEEKVEQEGENQDEILSDEEYDTMKAEEEEMKRISQKLLNRQEILEFKREIFGKEEDIKPIVVTDQDIAETKRRDTVKKIQSKGEEKSESSIKRINIKEKEEEEENNGEETSNGINKESEDDSNEIQKVNTSQKTDQTDSANEESDNTVVNKIVRTLKGKETQGSKVNTSSLSKGKFKKIIKTGPQFENEFGDRDGFRIESRFEGQVVVEPEPVHKFDNLIPSNKIIRTKEISLTKPTEEISPTKPADESPKKITKEENENPKQALKKTSIKDINTPKVAEAKSKQTSKPASSENENIPQQDTNSKTKSQKVDKIQKLQANKDKCLQKCANKNLTRLVCFSDGLVYIDLCAPICNGLKPRFLCSLTSNASTCGVQCKRKVNKRN